MKSVWKIATPITVVILVLGAALIWHLVKTQIANRKLVQAATTARARAEQGDAKAESDLAHMYYHGEGVPQDYSEAVRWYQKAADQGDAQAEYAMGYMYHQGQAVPKDEAEAIRWYQRAADRGNAKAEYVIAARNYYGQGVPQNYVEAARWYRKAADQGDAQAQVQFGYMEYYGRGLPQDFAQAATWYRKAADQGNATAQSSLGYMYYEGQGVLRDHAEAARWYYKAAKQGDHGAQRALSSMRTRFTMFSKISVSIAFLGSTILLIHSHGGIRNPQQRILILAGLLGLLWVGADVYRYSHFGILQALSAVNAFDFAKHILTGTSVAMLVFIVRPRGAKTLLRVSAILLVLSAGLGIYAVALHQLARLALPVRLIYLTSGLSIGMSIPSVIFLWWERKKPEGIHNDDGNGVVPEADAHA